MRIPRSPKPPKLGPYIPKRLPLQLSRFMEDLETIRSWSQEYPYLGIPPTSFNKLYKLFAKLKPKVESLNSSAEQYNRRLQKSSSGQTSCPNTKRCVSVKTASRNSGTNPRADGADTQGWLKELSKDSKTSPELSRSLLLYQRSFEHSIKEDFDCTFHLFEVQDRAGNPKKDESTTNIADSPKTGIAYRSESESKPSMTPSKSAEPINSNSEGLEWNLPSYNVVHGRGLISTIFSKLVAMPSQISEEMWKTRRLELVGRGSKDSGFDEEHILELLDLAVISYLQDLSREEVLNAAQATVKESLLPACHMAIVFEIPPLEGEDAG